MCIRDRNKIMHWEDGVKLPWGILLLFGGGLAIAQGFQTTGLANWIGLSMSQLDGFSVIIILIVIVTTVNFLTEITSNLATTAMLLPILAPTAMVLDVHPFLLMVGATLAASCAFMLPVATPPNAIVYGSNKFTIATMMRAGFALNIIGILVVTIFAYYFAPLIF